MNNPSIHDIRESLKIGESKILILDNTTGYTVGVVRQDDSQFLILSSDELIDLYCLIKKQIRKK